MMRHVFPSGIEAEEIIVLKQYTLNLYPTDTVRKRDDNLENEFLQQIKEK